MNETNDMVKDKLEEVWHTEIKIVYNNATPNQQQPQAFVLGGQPGAGKASMSQVAGERLDKNVVIINGDDLRKYYPEYKRLQKEQGQDAPKYTAEFAGKMTEAILKKAIDEKYNIIIEGTFRTSETPIKTLQHFKDNGYTTHVLIQTCHQSISWQTCLDRYERMLHDNPKEARFTDKKHHDVVVQNLAKNIQEVQNSGLVDHMQIFVRIPTKGTENEFQQKEIYNSSLSKIVNISTINQYLFDEKN
ncbi:MAG: zeta toxin family protein [Campylobacterales bacterium]|nr:zeta toxin family protein [Campylobacterales bacterium]MBN2831828.1 zeta toxin family protein [Campylobacterales bacterium]